MGRILRYAIALLLADITMINYRVLANATSTVAKSFEKEKIKPDVIPVAPNVMLKAEYKSGRKASLGNEITPVEAKDQPYVSWPVDPFALYTLAFVDPDVPSRQNPILREFNHWLVGNIPGDNVSKGDTLAPYLPPTPPAGSGLHRYVFLLYKQKGKIDFDEPRNLELTEELRIKFSISAFAKKYAMEGPVAGNFFFSQAAAAIPPLS